MFGDKARVVYEGDGGGGGRDGGVGSASLGSNAPEVSSVCLDLREEGSFRVRQDQASGLLSMRDLCLAFISRFESPYLWTLN